MSNEMQEAMLKAAEALEALEATARKQFHLVSYESSPYVQKLVRENYTKAAMVRYYAHTGVDLS